MPKSRLSETIGVQRVRVGNKAKTEAWLVKGSACKYLLIAVFIIVGCFVAAIVATQITFVSEKQKLVNEEKAHAAVETVLEKRFLEVGSLLENELRRRLKHTKMSEAVHAAVQAKLEDIVVPAETVYPGDPEYEAIVSDVMSGGAQVMAIMDAYAQQMKDESKRSERLLSAIARHLGGDETADLIEDTNDEGTKALQEKLSKDEIKARIEKQRAASRGKGLKERTAEQRERFNRFKDAGNLLQGGKDGEGGELDELDLRRQNLKERFGQKGAGKPRMRKRKDLAVKDGARGNAHGSLARASNDAGDAVASDSNSQSRSKNQGDAQKGEDFIEGRDLQSLLIRFFMRLNKIDSVVFPDTVKAEVVAIQEKHQDKVAQIQAESSTNREKSQKLRAHWADTLEELKTALEEDGVAGVETNELNHAAWMVDELLKEIINVIDVQDLKEPLFALEDKFKSGEDADAISVMKELQKMAREGDLPYEWVFGGSTGLSSAGAEEGGDGVNRMMGRPNRAHRNRDDDEDGADGEEGLPEDDGRGGPGVMGGAPQYMWWRDYPRQVDNPHWKPPPGMMDNFAFLDREREETERRRKEEIMRKEEDRHGGPRGPDRDGDGIVDWEDDDIDMSNRPGPPEDMRRRNHTRHNRGRPRRPPRGRRWGDFGVDENDDDDNNNSDESKSKRRGHGGRPRAPPKPRFKRNQDGDSNGEEEDGEDYDKPFGGFHAGRGRGGGHQKQRQNQNEDADDYLDGPDSNFRHHRPPPPPSGPEDDLAYADFGEGGDDEFADDLDNDDSYESFEPRHRAPHRPGHRGGDNRLDSGLDIRED